MKFERESLINIAYVVAVFLCIDLFALSLYMHTKKAKEMHKIKQDAAAILEYPDLNQTTQQ